MSTTSYSFDVTEENFASQVIEASHQAPVLVDFWATWCGPCQSLMPLLQKLADDYKGKFLLAKVEIDQQQNLATQFAVRSVPTVKLVKNGQIVDEFTGALPEGEIRAFLEKHIEHESDQLMQQAVQTYQQGQIEQALQQMQQLILDDPANEQNRVIFATVLLRENRVDDAMELINSLSTEMKESDDVKALLAQLEFVNITKDAPDINSLQARLDSDPSDCEARYQLSGYCMLQGDYEAGMQQLLEIVKRDRSYNDDAGRKTLLKVFDMLGGSGELVQKYRRALALLLN